MVHSSKFLSCVLVSFLSTPLYAAECKSWLQHLSVEHHVSVISKSGVKAANFQYIEIPNSPYRIAIPNNEFKNWKIEIKSLTSGSAFTVYNQAFGYSAEFDQEGTCLNSTGFVYDQMDRTVPQSLKGKLLTFNYDWKVCDHVNSILSQNKLKVNQKTSDEVAALIKKTRPLDFAILEKLSKTAGTSALHQTQSTSVDQLLSTCSRQTQYLEMTVGHSPMTQTKKPSPVAQ